MHQYTISLQCDKDITKVKRIITKMDGDINNQQLDFSIAVKQSKPYDVRGC